MRRQEWMEFGRSVVVKKGFKNVYLSDSLFLFLCNESERKWTSTEKLEGKK